jgi:hypothetical protein
MESANPTFSTAEVHAMQRATVKLFDHWDISDREAALLMGNIPEQSYRGWENGDYGQWTVDLALRLSNLIGIHKALRVLYADRERGYRWIKTPNLAFGDRTALEIMLSGNLSDLIKVREYLDGFVAG